MSSAGEDSVLKVVSVLPIGPFNSAFSYFCEFPFKEGDIVEIPFGRRKVLGIILYEQVKNDIELKTVCKVFNFNIDYTYRKFLNWMSSYTLIPRGYILKMILAERSIFQQKFEKPSVQVNNDSWKFSKISLNVNQVDAYNAIVSSFDKPFLLHGVTGSGKTEIYLSVAQNIIKKQRQVLILLPEIMLSKQISDRVQKYFGYKPFLWNSDVTPKNRRLIWEKVISGEPILIIGTRSALFLPFINLGIIIVDEEHDSSYKQEEMGFYNARDMAVVLGNFKKICVILSTATPSLESYVNAQNSKYGYFFVENKFFQVDIAKIDFIDMRQCKSNGFISPILIEEIKRTVQRKEQCLIYLNRRGYSPITLCKSCGEKISCPNCTCWLVYHRRIDTMICHYCGHKMNLPKLCKSCGDQGSYIQFGPGVERVYEELSIKLPNLRMEIVSSDTISSNTDISDLLNKIHNGDLDIVIGTQILAKGHHFPNITFVGVIDGDLGLNSADLRSSEKIYQLMNQVSGRAGRAEKQGKILIQTFNPNHSLFIALKTGKEKDFLAMEIASRKQNQLPPFVRLASIIISGINEKLTEEIAQKVANLFLNNINICIFGPVPAPLYKLRGRIRWRVLLKSSKKYHLSKIINQLIDRLNVPKNIKIQVDIDPISFF